MSQPTGSAIRIYTRGWCGYCTAARRLLADRGAGFEEIPVGSDRELRRSISAANGDWPTLPMIFIGETFVGGYRELAELDRGGKLEAMLEEID